MNRSIFTLLLPFLLAACVTVNPEDREAYSRLTGDRLEQLDQKLVSWSSARSADNFYLEEILRRDLRREAGRLAESLKLGLASSDPKKRATCAASLGFSEDEGAVGLLAELLRDPNADVRSAAMLGLCLLRSRKTPVDPILRALEDLDPLIRRHAVLCLGFLYEPGTLPDLFDSILKALSDTDAGVRINATSLLEKIGEIRAAPSLARLVVSDASAMVRRNAAIGLARLRVPATVPNLVEGLKGEMNPKVREEIVAALEKITGQTFGDDRAAWEAYLDTSGTETPPPGPGEEGEEPASK